MPAHRCSVPRQWRAVMVAFALGGAAVPAASARVVSARAVSARAVSARVVSARALIDLATVAPTIVQDLRYATADNFTGARVDGYSPEHVCRLERRTAHALAAVQRDLNRQGLSLKVYDCHRPESAVAAFAHWAIVPATATDQTRFFPRVAKNTLHARGFISYRSAHTSGTAVDVGLMVVGAPDAPAFDPGRRYGDCTAPVAERAPDAAVDLGTGYDCFDAQSAPLWPGLSPDQRRAQLTLRGAMVAHGFRPYAREWWHFTYIPR